MPGLRALDPKLWPGHPAMLAVDDVDALVSAAQMNTIEFHTLNSTTAHIDQPDRVIFDLDPGEGVTWPHIQEAALLVRALLAELDLASWLKTSGGKGLHVVVPLERRYTWDQMKSFSHAISVQLEQSHPDEYISTASKAARKGRIFVDYLRNSRGATAVAPYSVRARPGASVSTPLSWKELESLSRPDVFHMDDVLARTKRADPWAKFLKSPQKLPSGIQVAERG
jgi:bifunctional non-homologous end joining protein LigD